MRRKKKENRDLMLDPLYDSRLVAKLTNHLMFSGKKSTAQRVMWGALEEIKKAVKKETVKNVTKTVKPKAVKVSKATVKKEKK